MSRFVIEPTPFSGLTVIQRTPIRDERGFLARLFCRDELAIAGWQAPVAQINHTQTLQAGTIRGMHYQTGSACEAKLIQCIHGAVWDVVVDIRPHSPTFLQTYALKLSAENANGLLVPEGFAHGFQTLSTNAELIYLHSKAYAPDAQGTLNPQDPTLDINWPLPISQLSDKDRQAAFIDATFQGVNV